MSEVEIKFKKAAYLIKHGPPNNKTPMAEKLQHYAVLQASDGR